LRELRALGLIERLPRLAVIQAAGANPFYQAFVSGFGSLRPVSAHTVATAISIGNPANYPRARRSIVECNGIVAQVTDTEIMDAKQAIDRAGIGCEPASGATLAGLRQLVSSGVIRPDSQVVGVLTGHILKDTESIAAHQTARGWDPLVAAATPAAVRRVLEGAIA
jgi:threonine synthase